MKILIVSRSFYPEISPRSFRTTELVKEFSRQGHEVTLLTIRRDFDYSKLLNDYPFKIKTMGKFWLKVLSRSKWKIIGDLKRKFGRFLYFIFNYPEIELVWRVKQSLKTETGFDLMISVAVPYPVHWGTALARKKNHQIAKTWVADCGDPYYLNTLESFHLPFYFAWIEKWFSRKADYITIPFENLMNGFFHEFHPKIRVIPQGFNFDSLNLPNNEPNNSKPTFAYAGGVARKGVRNMIPLLNLFLKLKNEFEFHIYATTGREIIIPLCDKSNGKIVIHEPVPREILLQHLVKMDFLINLLIEGTETKQAPSKLIDYAISGRPILNIDPLKPNINHITNFFEKNYTQSYSIPNIEQYNIKNVAQKFLELAE